VPAPTVKSASAVKASAAMETATATVEAIAPTMKAATHVAAEPATRRETTAEPAAIESSSKAASATEATTTAEARTEPTPAEAATEPGSSSDKDASGEPIRPVVAVRRAGIRIVAVVAVSACRRCVAVVVTITRTIDRPAESNADRNSLRVGGNSRRQDANAE
jgi:hypothetical protein